MTTKLQGVGSQSGGGPSLNGALVNRDVIGGTVQLLTSSWLLEQFLVQIFATNSLSHGRR